MENFINKIKKEYNLKNIDEIDIKHINKINLNFNKKKICYFTNKVYNLYCCLFCGIYMFGKSENTSAFQHSLKLEHKYFLNLENKKIYYLPDNIEINNEYFFDIIYNIEPIYLKEDIKFINKYKTPIKDIKGREFYIGYLLIKSNHFLNLFIQIITKSNLIKNSFLINKFENNKLLNIISKIIRSLYNPLSFNNYIIFEELKENFQFLNNNELTINKDFSKFYYYFISNFPTKLNEIFNIKIYKKIIDEENNETNQIDSNYYLEIKIPETPVFKFTSKKVIPEFSIEELIKNENNIDSKINLDKKIIKYIVKFPKFLIIKINRSDYNNKINHSIINYDLILEIKNYETENNIKYKLIGNILQTDTSDNFKYFLNIYDEIYKSWFQIIDNEIKKIKEVNLNTINVHFLIYKLIN